MMLNDRLEDIAHAQFRALAQLIIDPTEGVKAFEQYTKVAFPGFEKRREQQSDNLKKELFDWIKSGPRTVTVQGEFRATSRMKSRAVRVQNELVDRVVSKAKKGGRSI